MRSVFGFVALAFVGSVLPLHLWAQTSPSGENRPDTTARGTAPTGGPTSREPASRASVCQVEGAWELVSASDSTGTQQPLQGWRQRKLLAHGHFMWLGAETRRDTLPLRTAADSLRVYRTAGGTGTYTVSGNGYTEHIYLFVDPTFEGRPYPATCRTEGDLWYHTFMAQGTRQRVEVWRRIR